ncbi:MAG: phosphoribosylformimino-5-aminoimidazole carboxamide ribotide isomerase [Clostridiales bacterium]|nr:phosphoribosylformimino-5-aminoimidazole carboxamide ribotide isomerase [Clostridiales bacterium]
MRFRPCIDIHNGAVKQIVGGSLRDEGSKALENFVSEKGASYYALLYREHGLDGGHIILLNPPDSPYHNQNMEQARKALHAYPKGLQIGGGINAQNAETFLKAGASHVIVTSYVFQDGQIRYDNLEQLKSEVGKENVVLDLSCRRREDDYYIVTNRWQTFTQVKITKDILEELSSYCDEYLIHAVDVEGKACGIERPLVTLLSGWNRIPMTYAGGVGTMEDVKELKLLGQGAIDVTIGSALDLFGGTLPFSDLVQLMHENNTVK